MNRFACVLLVASCVVTTSVGAQGTMVVVQNKCALDKQGPLHRATDSLWFPVVQELVNEGKLTGAGSAFHSWGDEWNMVLWYSATSHTAFLSAFSEMASRLNQRHPTYITQLLSSCSEHKESMYDMGKATTPGPIAPARRPE